VLCVNDVLGFVAGGTVLMVDVEREFACGRGTFNVIMDANAELPTMHAIGDCVLTKRSKSVPIRCGISAAQLEGSVSPIMLSLRCWEILSRCGVFPPGHTWLPNLTDVRIQSVSGTSIPVATMALAESFADNLVDVTTTNGDSVHVRVGLTSSHASLARRLSFVIGCVVLCSIGLCMRNRIPSK
jgi:hypothetical protein